MPINFIGPYPFVEIARQVDIPGEDIQVVQRPGVDGTILRRLGERGKPFTVISRVDVQSFQAGHNAIYAYKQLKKGNPLQVMQNNIVWLPYVFAVIDVQTTTLRQIAAAVGGINPPSLAWLECIWTLLAITPNQEQ